MNEIYIQKQRHSNTYYILQMAYYSITFYYNIHKLSKYSVTKF